MHRFLGFRLLHVKSTSFRPSLVHFVDMEDHALYSAPSTPRPTDGMSPSPSTPTPVTRPMSNTECTYKSKLAIFHYALGEVQPTLFAR